MQGDLKVYVGFWSHQDQGLLLTVTSFWNRFIQFFFGFLFGIVQPHLERIVSHLLGWILYCYMNYGPRIKLPNDDGQATNQRLDRRLRHGARVCMISSARFLDATVRSTGPKIISVIVTLAGIAYAVAGDLVTSIPADSSALSHSDTCGQWDLIDGALPAAQDAEQLFQAQKETRAAGYAGRCYVDDSSLSNENCHVFARNTVAATESKSNQPCPFVDQSYCDQTGDGFNAETFTTKSVKVNDIGVNTNQRLTFNRTTTCVALNIHQGFVEKLSGQPGHWGYKLGSVASDEYSSNYTFSQYGDPFAWDVRSYTMSTYEHAYARPNEENYWEPIEGLNIREDLTANNRTPHSLTIMFINSCRIFYRTSSDDPIFPADRRWADSPDLWTNNDSRARPLACVDWVELCSNQNTCRPLHESDSADSKYYNLTKAALRRSNIYNAIQYRGANGLDAQAKISDDTSLDLHHRQWAFESKLLFETSLARIQYDALDIANGTGRELPRLEQKLPEWTPRKFCDMLTFHLPQDYANIRVWPTCWVLMFPMGVWLLSWKTGKKLNEDLEKSGCFDDKDLIGFEWLFWELGFVSIAAAPPRSGEDQ